MPLFIRMYSSVPTFVQCNVNWKCSEIVLIMWKNQSHSSFWTSPFNIFPAMVTWVQKPMQLHWSGVMSPIISSRVSDLYSSISDAELDSTIKEIQRMYPNSGYRIIHGHLQARGLHVQSKSSTLSLMLLSFTVKGHHS